MLVLLRMFSYQHPLPKHRHRINHRRRRTSASADNLILSPTSACAPLRDSPRPNPTGVHTRARAVCQSDPSQARTVTWRRSHFTEHDLSPPQGQPSRPGDYLASVRLGPGRPRAEGPGSAGPLRPAHPLRDRGEETPAHRGARKSRADSRIRVHEYAGLGRVPGRTPHRSQLETGRRRAARTHLRTPEAPSAGPRARPRPATQTRLRARADRPAGTKRGEQRLRPWWRGVGWGGGRGSGGSADPDSERHPARPVVPSPSPLRAGVPNPLRAGVPSPLRAGIPSPLRAGIPSQGRPSRTFWSALTEASRAPCGIALSLSLSDSLSDHHTQIHTLTGAQARAHKHAYALSLSLTISPSLYIERERQTRVCSLTL